MNSIVYKYAKNILPKSNFVLCAKSMKNMNNYSTVIAQEQKIKIGEGIINYVKVGTGKNVVLCFPGALGTIWSDFKPQVTKLDPSIFTVVAFDPPGYGFSRPPDRKFTLDFYKRDAFAAHQLMKELGHTKFSLLGWSDGGISSLILTANFPDSVEKLIVWGANSYLLPEDIDAFERIRDTKNWSDKAKAPLIELYGEKGLQTMWSGWCDVMQQMQKNGGNICMDAVAKIKCPTLILHGGKDPIVLDEHPNYLNANIRDSRMYVFPQGKHNIHLRYADDFNKIVTEFILEQ